VEVAVEDPTAIDDVSAAPGEGDDERRRSRRYLCNGFAEVMVVRPECLFRGEIRNISQNGCFVISRAHVQLERHAEAEMRFKLNNRQFRVRARVMSVLKGDGVGFEFLGVNRDTEELLRNLITELSRNLG
jgi:hypothetical protein